MTHPTSWLARCDPTVKAVGLLVVSLVTLFLFEPLPLAAMFAAALVGARMGARVRWRLLGMALVPLALFGLGLLVVNALSRPGEPLLPDAPVRVTAEGLVVGLALALRALVIGTLSIGFLASTPPRELLTSLMQHARLSPRYAFAVLAGHRMLAAMPRTWATIRSAHAVRAPSGRGGRPRLGARGFARCAFALLVDAIRASERTALALESRGLGDGPRTIWRPAGIGRPDALLGVALAVLLGGAVLATAL